MYTIVSPNTSSEQSAEDKLKVLQLKPFGFNYYSLIMEVLWGQSGQRSSNLNYIASTGANLVRIALGGFSASDYITKVHNSGSMPRLVSDSNLNPTYVAACDSAMDALSSRGLKAIVCGPWSQDAIPTAFGLSNASEYASTSSSTSLYVKSFVQWWATRYKKHPAYAIHSIFNEPVVDESGVSNPTSSQLGTWLSFVASSARLIKSDLLVTTDLTSPATNLLNTREGIEEVVARYRVIFSGLDVYNLHIYGDAYGWVGHNSTDYGLMPNIYYSNAGYEGASALAQAYVDMARADGKPLIFGEFGVSTSNEADDPLGENAAFVNNRKKWRLSKALVPRADVSLVWNVQQVTGSPSNQDTWLIDPVARPTRASQFAAIASAFNNSKPTYTPAGCALSARRALVRPTVSMRCNNRSSGYNIKLTTTSGYSSSVGYSVAFWMNLSTTLNNAEIIFDLRGTGNVSGLVGLANLVSGARGFYTDGRYASGSSGATYSALPDLNIGEWNHFAIMHNSIVINGTTIYRSEIWINGLYWLTVSAPAAPGSIPSGVVVYPFGNSSNGVPLRMQDFSLFKTMTAEDVWGHIRGDIHPQALIHIRAFDNGDILDMSKNSASLTITGVSTYQE